MTAQSDEVKQTRNSDGLNLHGIFNGSRVDYRTLVGESDELDAIITSLGNKPTVSQLLALNTRLSDYLIKCEYFFQAQSDDDVAKQALRNRADAIKEQTIQTIIDRCVNEIDSNQKCVLFELFAQPTGIRQNIYTTTLAMAEQGDVASINLITAFNWVILAEAAEQALNLLEEIRSLAIWQELLVPETKSPLQPEAQKDHQERQGLKSEAVKTRELSKNVEMLKDVHNAYERLYDIVRNINSSDQYQLSRASELLAIIIRFEWLVDGVKQMSASTQTDVGFNPAEADITKLYEIILEKMIIDAEAISARIRNINSADQAKLESPEIAARCRQVLFQLSQTKFVDNNQRGRASQLKLILEKKFPRLLQKFVNESSQDKPQNVSPDKTAQHQRPTLLPEHSTQAVVVNDENSSAVGNSILKH